MYKPRKILSNLDAPYIQSIVALASTQTKLTLVTWCVDYAEAVVLPLFLKYEPEDERPRLALKAAREFMAKKIKFPEAKQAILACHAAARKASDNPVAQAAARAIGQSASSIHVARHCLGLALYGALALAYERVGADAEWSVIEAVAAEECAKMEEKLRNLIG